ncbi:zinc finger protein 184-like isoform X1 [Plodia interpunctella]|uniref:zinc finger protein 184-like isoform X1 n=1 Tax=Plodia interpunctella TaxID=58824 RepID=UPI00236863A2|nr:zinc finger protein 184-like isoform X1 [Plodia interpunctella]
MLDAVCRICLAVDAHDNMLSLIPVQDLYEKITNNRLHHNNISLSACYVCYAQLKRCHKFITKSAVANDILFELLQMQSEITPKSVSKVDRKARGLISPLSMSLVTHEDFPFKPEIVIKTEPMQEEVEIKVEVEEYMAVSDGGGRDNSGVNTEVEFTKVEGYGGSGSPNTRITEESGDLQVALSLEANIEIDEEAPHTGTEKIFKMEERETNVTNKKLLKIRTGKSHECTICHKRYNQNSILRNHLRTHTGEKPFECNICDSVFAQVSSLNRHLKAHIGEKPYECDICKRKFLQKSELKKHSRIHTGEKPYKCEVCYKSFSLKAHLISHMRGHTGEKPYQCNICNAKYKERSHLKRHLKVHSGEKPFECNVCAQRFRRKCNLKSHLMTHTGEKPFSCNICKRSFCRPSRLKLHKCKEIHNVT